MKTIVADILTAALVSLPELADVTADLPVVGTIERTRDPSHGDFASNIAMRLAKPAHSNPRALAERIVARLGESDAIDKVEIAGPGFINFHLSASAYHGELATVLEQGVCFGRQEAREHPRILLEFVSANPTGPLHVGHGRLAAFGATVGNLLEAAGYPVEREYYVNDAGRQMDILGVSVYLRWLEAQGMEVPFPDAGYREVILSPYRIIYEVTDNKVIVLQFDLHRLSRRLHSRYCGQHRCGGAGKIRVVI